MSSLTSGGRSSRSSISQSLGRSIKSPLGMSHSIGRNLAKVAVDSLSLSGIQNSEWKKGDKFDYMPTLGEDEYSKLCNDKELVLVTINYCQQGLPTNLSMANLRELIGGSFNVTQEQVEGVNEVSSRSLINHDYLVLELQGGGGEKYYIRAHKLQRGGDQEKAGIYINPLEKKAVKNELNNGVKLYAIKCGVHIPLMSIIKTLKAANPDYNLRDNNCWDYATFTAKELALECSRVAGITSVEKARLEKESSDLEANLTSRHIFHTVYKALKKLDSL